MVFVCLFAIVGIAILYGVFAATGSSVSVKPQTGTTPGNASAMPYSTATVGSASESGSGGTGSASPVATSTAGALCATTTTSLAIHVCNGELVNGSGQAVQLRGVDVTGTEDACILDEGFSWGASNTQAEDTASASAMRAWGINAVRIPLNEDCWLGINGAPAAYSGANYQTNIKNWVTALNNAGIYTILDLHWTAPGTIQATQQWPMADESHSVTFWSQVATAYKSDPAVLFDLFNEPYIDGSYPTASDWSCWLNGCNLSTADAPSGYQTAGMQQMLDAVRAAGATQPVMIGGLNWAGNPCQSDGDSAQTCPQLSNMPTDTLSPSQLVISIHSYQQDTIACTSTSCLNNLALTMKAAKIPVVAGEIGDGDGQCDYVQTFMDWADQQSPKISYLAWSWQAGTSIYDLVTNWSGTPNPPEGPAIESHLQGNGDISC